MPGPTCSYEYYWSSGRGPTLLATQDAFSIGVSEPKHYTPFELTKRKIEKFFTIQLFVLNPKNPCLRENVLLGQISVEKIGVMTTHEMASAEMKDLRESFIKTLALKCKRAATEFDSSCAVKTVKQKKIEETMNEQMMDTYLRYNL
uniref:TFIIS central domain-containing protein n=1 Tax=Strigamia maritima TaxID=126957 RepID=T1IH42_STRMM